MGWVIGFFGVKIVFRGKILKVVRRKDRRCLEIWVFDVKIFEMLKLLVMFRFSVRLWG